MAEKETLYEEMDIMLLILLVAARLSRPVSFNELWKLVFVDNNISYFDYCTSLDKLVRNGQMALQEDGNYLITDEGKANGGTLEDMIPRKLKPLVEQAAAAQRAIDKREACIKTESVLRPNGEYVVTLGLDDDVDCVFRLQLIAPNAENAQKMMRMFRKNPETIFSEILDSVFREREPAQP